MSQPVPGRQRGLYLGAAPDGWMWTRPESALLVLGPPRSGKTTSVVVPNVLVAEGPVVSTSTKTDVMAATARQRAARGRCWLFDPSGRVAVPEGVTRLSWSPVAAAGDWDSAMATAHALVASARPARGMIDADHWSERARALLAPLLHAAALDGAAIDTVLHWVNRHQLGPAGAILAGHGARLAVDCLAGVVETEARERSGILSTAAGTLAAYQSEAALAGARAPNFDPAGFATSTDTVYVCATARDQSSVAPLVVGLLGQLAAAGYGQAEAAPGGAPMTLVLDEVANIAPLPQLPELVSEGGGQGVLTLACFQDLSQARARWGSAADGFLTMFGAKLVLAGVADTRTLAALSDLCGQTEAPVRSFSHTGPWWRRPSPSTSTSWSTRRQPRVPVDELARGRPGQAFYLEGGGPPAMVALTPSYRTRPWRDLVAGPSLPAREPRAASRGLER